MAASVLKEGPLQRSAWDMRHGHRPYNPDTGVHHAIDPQAARSLTPRAPPPIVSWPTLSPSVPCSQQRQRVYNYPRMSPICCNSFASLIFW